MPSLSDRACAYHEIGHALAALEFGFEIERVSVLGGNGVMKLRPGRLSPTSSDAEIERALGIVFAGEFAAELA